MMYLSKEELVKNIALQTERAEAVIGHIDFSSDKLNPNTVIIPFLSNIFDSALIVTALEDSSNAENDCHRNAFNLILNSVKTKNNMKDYIRHINNLKQKYTSENNADTSFNSGECLDFLNAYDCFMYSFAESSTTLKNMKNNGSINFRLFSFRNMTEKILRKNMPSGRNNNNNPSGDFYSTFAGQLKYNNELLENILKENRITNEYLKNINKILLELNNNGGNKNE